MLYYDNAEVVVILRNKHTGGFLRVCSKQHKHKTDNAGTVLSNHLKPYLLLPKAAR